MGQAGVRVQEPGTVVGPAPGETVGAIVSNRNSGIISEYANVKYIERRS